MVRESVLRYRMNGGHYLGGIVQPNIHLDIYGDVGTELCVLQDGDESLFAGYEDVEFLEDVYEGDYIECRGEIVKLCSRRAFRTAPAGICRRFTPQFSRSPSSPAPITSFSSPNSSTRTAAPNETHSIKVVIIYLTRVSE